MYIIHSIDNGFCRVYYRNTVTNKLLCFQECGTGSIIDFELLECERRTGEPSHIAQAFGELPAPEGNSTIERNLRAWLKLGKHCKTLAALDAHAQAQANAHGVSREAWAKTIEDCAAITEINELEGGI
jgi:hypothetical protein